MQRLAGIRHIVLDMDGTIYRGNQLFDFTGEFFNMLRKLNIGYTYLTNNSSRSVQQYLQKIRQMGLPGAAENIYTSSLATISYLQTEHPEIKILYILGTDGLKTEFREQGFTVVADNMSEPDAVIVGFDTSLTFDPLCKAAYWIKRGKPFIATHPDRTCPADQPTLLVDCGALCAALTSATGHKPDAVLGKPDPAMINSVLARNRLMKEEVAMVGDRLYTDLEMAHRSGIMGILVLSGEASRADVRGAANPPDLVVENIGELAELLITSRN